MNSINMMIGLGVILVAGYLGSENNKKSAKNYKDEILQLRQERRVSKQKVTEDLKSKGKDLRGQNYYLHLKKATREQKIRNILEQIFRVPFKSCRPSWLINPKTNRRLELDCYNPSLRTAFEIDGEQHSKYLPFYHRKYQNYVEMKERDMIKSMICLQKEIKLIRIPYTIDENDLEEYILMKVGNMSRQEKNILA